MTLDPTSEFSRPHVRACMERAGHACNLFYLDFTARSVQRARSAKSVFVIPSPWSSAYARSCEEKHRFALQLSMSLNIRREVPRWRARSWYATTSSGLLLRYFPQFVLYQYPYAPCLRPRYRTSLILSREPSRCVSHSALLFSSPLSLGRFLLRASAWALRAVSSLPACFEELRFHTVTRSSGVSSKLFEAPLALSVPRRSLHLKFVLIFSLSFSLHYNRFYYDFNSNIYTAEYTRIYILKVTSSTRRARRAIPILPIRRDPVRRSSTVLVLQGSLEWKRCRRRRWVLSSGSPSPTPTPVPILTRCRRSRTSSRAEEAIMPICIRCRRMSRQDW